ncbi:MAG: GTPase Era [Gammaproteobacteria bacterium]|nr:GTPase Era [Gammaproteobacteria bacterium]MBL6819069.1 GTPase Era [Gammaproteobacteria bacterium]MBL6898720.1 GTPase Era [Gammaproteobacteria bacterium]
MKTIKLLIIGKSNVGKSSLINHLLKNHSALVSNKLHATRIASTYRFNYKNFNIEIIDTPGASVTNNNLLSQAMKSNSMKYITSANIIILLTQPQSKYDYEMKIIDQIRESGKSFIIVVNKIDLDLNKRFEKELLSSLSIKQAIYISVTESINFASFYMLLDKHIDTVTASYQSSDKDLSYSRSNIQELIREAIVNRTNEELPYESAVLINDYKEQNNSIVIKADIIVSKENHKKIIIGKKGSMIKNIGIKARKVLEDSLVKKVHLSLFVVVKSNWKNNPNILKDLGYID